MREGGGQPALFARERHAWRAWLTRHHASEPEVWLLFYKKHTGKPCVALDAAVEEALCFGWVLAARREETRQRRIHTVVERARRGLKPGIDL